MRIKIQLLLLLFQLPALFSIGQKPYHITIEIDGNIADTFYLARYYTNKILLSDTSAHGIGTAIFEGDKELAQGIYILANNKKEKIAELLVGEEQNFSIKLFENGSSAEVNGSIENELFFKHIDISSYVFKSNDSLNRLKNNSESDKLLDNRIKALTDSLIDYRNQVVKSHPEALFSKILLAMEEPNIPDSLVSNQEKAFIYYKTHFWDNFDLSDARLLNTPLLPKKLETYFNQLTAPIADSVIKEVDYLLALSEGSQETIDFLAWHFVSEYQTPKIMGLDKVFVHLSDYYFTKAKVSNVTESILDQIVDRANKIRPGLIGNQAPALWLMDTNGDYRSFNEIDVPYTVLAFWDQTCGHCKKELELLNKLYTSRKFEFEVFAINTTNDLEGWKNYLQEKNHKWINVNGTRSMSGDFHDLYDIHSVPVFYLLDQNKKIIAKRFAIEQLEEILKNHTKNINR
jgi:thiol-disulfide isomerase/thioredoxin